MRYCIQYIDEKHPKHSNNCFIAKYSYDTFLYSYLESTKNFKWHPNGKPLVFNSFKEAWFYTQKAKNIIKDTYRFRHCKIKIVPTHKVEGL